MHPRPGRTDRPSPAAAVPSAPSPPARRVTRRPPGFAADRLAADRVTASYGHHNHTSSASPIQLRARHAVISSHRKAIFVCFSCCNCCLCPSSCTVEFLALKCYFSYNIIIVIWSLGEMQRIAFHLMLSSWCVCVCVCMPRLWTSGNSLR